PTAIHGVPLTGIVRIDTINPGAAADLAHVWNLKDGADWEELDFDAPYTYPESEGLSQHFDTFENPTKLDRDQEAYRQANVLSIRIRYWYELRIPLANWLLFLCWYAARAATALPGALERPTLSPSANVLNRSVDLEELESRAQGPAHEKGWPTLYRS